MVSGALTLKSAKVGLGPFSQQVCSTLSPRFRDWLIDAFYRDHGEPPGDYALRQTIRTLEARALSSGPRLPVHRRLAARGNPRQPDAILLDLDNADGEIVEITPTGWQITTDPTAAFLHSRGNAELPHPTSQSQSATCPQLRNRRRPHAPHRLATLRSSPHRPASRSCPRRRTR
jgi:hypothetical protein